MAIKFEKTTGAQDKPTEKRPIGIVEDKKKGEPAPEEAEEDTASQKTKKPRAGFRKK